MLSSRLGMQPSSMSKKSRKQLEAQRLAEEQERAARKERRRLAREARELEASSLAETPTASASKPMSATEPFFEEDNQGREPEPLDRGAVGGEGLYSGEFLRRFVCVSFLGLAITCGAAVGWRRSNPLPSFQLGTSTLVTIKSEAPGVHGHAYLQVAQQDGLLRASAGAATEPGTTFRVLVLSSGTVRALKLAAASRERLVEANERATRTKSGCQCSGFSNEYGFGRFCHPWESASQEPWCYVDAVCTGAAAGSFGRRHEACAEYAPSPLYNGSAVDPLAGGDASSVDERMPRPFTGEDGEGWRPRSACPCSGYSNAHGFGAYCRGWEVAGQTPWCYVHDNCSLASAQGNGGSFGHRYLDCVPDTVEPRTDDAVDAAATADGGAAGRRLSVGGMVVPAPSDAFHAWDDVSALPRAVEEESLLEHVERMQQPYVALVSTATEGFLAVEPPPHKLSLLVHARTDELSLRSVFTMLPSGALMSLATNALLNLCAPHGWELGDVQTGGAPAAEKQEAPLVCTGTEASAGQDQAHKLLLRNVVPTARFAVRRAQ